MPCSLICTISPLINVQFVINQQVASTARQLASQCSQVVGTLVCSNRCQTTNIIIWAWSIHGWRKIRHLIDYRPSSHDGVVDDMSHTRRDLAGRFSWILAHGAPRGPDLELNLHSWFLPTAPQAMRARCADEDVRRGLYYTNVFIYLYERAPREIPIDLVIN